MKFTKGVMRKRWVQGKDEAKKACLGKADENYLALYSKDDFGPKLDDVEDLFPKKATKVAEYRTAWTAANLACEKLKKKAQTMGMGEGNLAMQTALVKALDEIHKCLGSDDVKPG